MRGHFFAVGKPQWKAACELGMNPAIALLVLARGTGADNKTTAWSAEAIQKYSGITWRRAKAAIEHLVEHELAACTVSGKRPRYKIAAPPDMGDLIWLPNELVTGASGESPPAERLRQTQDVEILELFVDLYAEQELDGDCGLPRSLFYAHFDRKKIMDYGQFVVYGFAATQARRCTFSGPLTRYAKRQDGTAWEHVQVLESLGLLEWIHYLAESTDHDAELIHPLSGDAQDVAVAAERFAATLPEGFAQEAEQYDYVLPVLRHMANAAVVGLYRLRYRPKTSRTAAWYGQHVANCRSFAELYGRLGGENISLAG